MAEYLQTNSGELQRYVFYVKRWLEDTCEDEFTGVHAVYAKLREKKRVFKGTFGDEIVVPIFHPAAGGPQATGVVDPLALQTAKLMTGFTRSKWPVAEIMINVAIPRRELRANRPPAKMVDYSSSVWEATRERYFDLMRQHLWTAEGNAASAGSESQIASLLTLINKGGTSATGPYRPKVKAAQYSANNDSIGWTSGTHGVAAGTNPVFTIGGINRNTAGNVYFCAPVLNPSSAATFGRTPINQTITLARRGKDNPDVGFLDQSHWDQLQDTLQAQYLLKPSKLQQYGYASLEWSGVDITYDDDMPVGTGGGVTGQFIVLNTNKIGLYCDGDFIPDVIEDAHITEAPYLSYLMVGYYQLIPKLLGRGLGARQANLA
jgi:hypothetical protein